MLLETTGVHRTGQWRTSVADHTWSYPAATTNRSHRLSVGGRCARYKPAILPTRNACPQLSRGPPFRDRSSPCGSGLRSFSGFGPGVAFNKDRSSGHNRSSNTRCSVRSSICAGCFSFSGDPVEAALVSSFAHPGGNATGVTFLALNMSAKRPELISEITSGIKRLAVLSNPEHFGEASSCASRETRFRSSASKQNISP